jgi:hypothetical protein
LAAVLFVEVEDERDFDCRHAVAVCYVVIELAPATSSTILTALVFSTLLGTQTDGNNICLRLFEELRKVYF